MPSYDNCDGECKYKINALFRALKIINIKTIRLQIVSRNDVLQNRYRFMWYENKKQRRVALPVLNAIQAFY